MNVMLIDRSVLVVKDDKKKEMYLFCDCHITLHKVPGRKTLKKLIELYQTELYYASDEEFIEAGCKIIWKRDV